jgi:hypothetical protein
VKFPGRGQRDADPYEGVAWGGQLQTDNPRSGIIDDGNYAFPERIVEARRQWPEADAGDFEKVGWSTWRDTQSGIEYRALPGAPLLDIGSHATQNVACFIVSDGRLVVLRRADILEGT